VRSAHGAILLASGGVDQGYAEIQAAAQIRSDAPRRHNLAILMLMKGEIEAAQREVGAALAQYRDYAEAHVTLASLHITRSEFDLARTELEEATRLEPALPSLETVWAQFYAAQGNTREAIAHAERSTQLRAADPQAHILLAQLYYHAARYDDMKREARIALELIPSPQKDDFRREIRKLLGPTAFEDPERTEGNIADDTSRLPIQPPDSLKLELNQPGSSKYHLRDIDSKLHIK